MVTGNKYSLNIQLINMLIKFDNKAPENFPTKKYAAENSSVRKFRRLIFSTSEISNYRNFVENLGTQSP